MSALAKRLKDRIPKIGKKEKGKGKPGDTPPDQTSLPDGSTPLSQTMGRSMGRSIVELQRPISYTEAMPVPEPSVQAQARPASFGPASPKSLFGQFLHGIQQQQHKQPLGTIQESSAEPQSEMRRPRYEDFKAVDPSTDSKVGPWAALHAPGKTEYESYNAEEFTPMSRPPTAWTFRAGTPGVVPGDSISTVGGNRAPTPSLVGRNQPLAGDQPGRKQAMSGATGNQSRNPNPRPSQGPSVQASALAAALETGRELSARELEEWKAQRHSDQMARREAEHHAHNLAQERYEQELQQDDPERDAAIAQTRARLEQQVMEGAERIKIPLSPQQPRQDSYAASHVSHASQQRRSRNPENRMTQDTFDTVPSFGQDADGMPIIRPPRAPHGRRSPSPNDNRFAPRLDQIQESEVPRTPAGHSEVARTAAAGTQVLAPVPAPLPAPSEARSTPRKAVPSAASPKRAPKSENKKKKDIRLSAAGMLEASVLTRNMSVLQSVDVHERLDEEDDDEDFDPEDAATEITRLTNIVNLAEKSTFHDDTLCQLLDASKLNLIGGEAKKVLMRAARARVKELKVQVERRMASTAPLAINKKVKSGAPSAVEQATPDRGTPAVAPTGAASMTPTPASYAPPPHPVTAQHTAGGMPSNSGVTPITRDDIIREAAILLLNGSPARPSEFDAATNAGGFPGFPVSGIGSFQQQSQQQPQWHPIPDGCQVQQGYQQQAFSPPQFTNQQPMAQEYVSPGGSRVASAMAQGRARSVGHSAPPHQPSHVGQTLQTASTTVPISSVPSPPGPLINVHPPTAPASRRPSEFVPASGVSRAGSTGSRRSRTRKTSQGSKTPTQDRGPPSPQQQHAAYSGADAPPPVPPKDSSQHGSARASPAPPQSSKSRHSTPPDVTYTPRSQTPTQQARTSPHSKVDMITEQALESLPRTVASHLARSAARGAHSLAPVDNDSGGGKSSVHTITGYTGAARAPIQRLYTMAAGWDDASLGGRLNDIASPECELGSIPLTIYASNIFAKYLRSNEQKQARNERLLITALDGEKLNTLSSNNQHSDAALMLQSLWSPISDKAPRVVVAVTRHGRQGGWLAHRFSLDMEGGGLTSYHCADDKSPTNPYDLRPYHWLIAMRMAWPERNLREVDAIYPKMMPIITNSGDNALRAVIVARNLLVGHDPRVQESDWAKTRKTVWNMAAHLAKKKASGALFLPPTS